jgi:hypothetical protein
MAAGGAAAGAVQAIFVGPGSGLRIMLSPEEFLHLLSMQEAPLVVRLTTAVFFGRWWFYLNNYKGFTFHTRSKDPLPLPKAAEIVEGAWRWFM